MKILPLSHPEIGEKVLAAELPSLVLRPERFPFVVNRIPDVQQREEVRFRIVKTSMCRCRRRWC